MQVKVQYFGFIKNMLKKKEDRFELEEGATLTDLLDKMAGIHGAAFRKEVYEPGLKEVKMGFSVTVNGVLMAQLGGLKAKLSEGDNVFLMSLMTGG